LRKIKGARQIDRFVALRHSLWWGLLTLTIWTYAVNLWQPLGSSSVALLTVLLVVLGGFCGLALARKSVSWRGSFEIREVPWQWKAALGSVLVAVVYFACAAMGPVTNYDTGLYHLGAITYSAEYATIPGLANLYFPFGYSNAEFTLAALLSNGPWAANGFRLLNGLLIFLVGLELLFRVMSKARTKKFGPGIYVLFVGQVVSLIPLIAMADFWVASPTQDAAVFTLTVVASAYLVDTVHSRKNWVSSGVVLSVLAITLVLFRPTATFFAGAALLVVLLLAIRRKGSRSGLAWGSGLVVVSGAVALAASTARDYVLSGWFQYPLSLIAFPVEWRAVDPVDNRAATLGFHRNPSELWESVSGFNWVGVWFTNRFALWETYLFLVLGIVVVVLAVLVRKIYWRAIVLSVIPSLVAVTAWFILTPPSYRFAWGPIFTLLTIPMGWLLWKVAISKVAIAGGALSVVVISLFSAGFRLDWADINQGAEWRLGISIPYSVAPIIDVPVDSRVLPSGIQVLVPVETDQCWENYPLCTPQPSVDLRLLPSDQGGFAGGFLP
jgi:hypothetical protein